MYSETISLIEGEKYFNSIESKVLIILKLVYRNINK